MAHRHLPESLCDFHGTNGPLLWPPVLFFRKPTMWHKASEALRESEINPSVKLCIYVSAFTFWILWITGGFGAVCLHMKASLLLVALAFLVLLVHSTAIKPFAHVSPRVDDGSASLSQVSGKITRIHHKPLYLSCLTPVQISPSVRYSRKIYQLQTRRSYNLTNKHFP